METLASHIHAGVPASWTWKPLAHFEIDLTIGSERMVVTIESQDRREVAESLIRLASAVHPADQRAVFHMRCCDMGYFEESHECQKAENR
jgi:hypothetical protein